MPVDPITIRLATADDLAVLHSCFAHPHPRLALRHLERQEAGDYFFAPDGEDLAAIYRLVAGRIQECPKGVATPRAGRTGR